MARELDQSETPLLMDTSSPPLEITIDQDPVNPTAPLQQQQQLQHNSCTTSTSAHESSLRQCRICFEVEQPGQDDPTNPLISPCLCTGSSRYVHRNCLQQWRTTGNREDAFYQCEVCKFQYQYRRLWYAEVLGSIYTRGTLFVILLSLLCYAVGCITRWEADCTPGECNAVGRWALHMAGGLMAIALVGFLLGFLLLLFRCIILHCVVTSDDELPSGRFGRLCICLFAATELCLPRLRCIIITDFPPLVILQMFWYGIQVACLTLYVGLWLGFAVLFNQAQQMVENVSKGHDGSVDEKDSVSMALSAVALANAGSDDTASKDVEAAVGERASLLGGSSAKAGVT
jgi:small basic protein